MNTDRFLALRRLFAIVLLVGTLGIVALVDAHEARAADPVPLQSGPWESAPLNWKNSAYNYENSPYDFKNSPKNSKNAEGSESRINIVNLLGGVTGYVVSKKDGGINYFDNDGNRIGYSSDGGKSQFTPDGQPTEFRLK